MSPVLSHFVVPQDADALRTEAATWINAGVTLLDGSPCTEDVFDAGLAAAEAARFEYREEPAFAPSVAYMLGFDFALELVAELSAQPSAARIETIAALVLRQREIVREERRRLAEWPTSAHEAG